MESTEISTKSSNEILTELFGAFNAEPPKIKLKRKRSSSEGNESKHSKKVKKSKSKKSKKKHKSKSKKHKRKRSDDDSESDSSSVKGIKKKKKHKKRNESPSVNIELPVNKMPMALEIMLDGTVGIKGEDGVMTKIPDVCENEKNEIETEPELEPELEPEPEPVSTDNVNGELEKETQKDEEEGTNIVVNNKTDTKETVSDLKVPEIFETNRSEIGDKQKKGKIQIKDLKFSSVFQETVKAVEEQKKKEEEKKANYEEGELSDSTEDEADSRAEETGDRSKSKSVKDRSRHKHHSHSKSHCRRDDYQHSGKRKRSSRSKSRSTSRHRPHIRHHSHDRSTHKRFRSKSKDHHSFYSSRDSHRRHSPSINRSHHSSGRSRESPRSRSRSHRSRSTDRRKSSHRSKSKDYSKEKSRDRSESVEKIDKEKLLAIARKNALKLIDAGVVPGAEKLTTIKAGGKTVNELTEYCKKLSEKEALGDDVSDIESESSEDEEKPFHHPFQVRDRPSSIIMNIKNSTPLPVKSLQEKAAEQAKQLRLQFPVSSGSSHRRTESEWVPVSPKREEPPVVKAPAVSQIPVQPPPLPLENPPLPQPPHAPPPMYLSAVPPPAPINKPIFPVIQPNPPMSKLDISSIVSKRLEAIRKLQENPNDSQALNQMYSAQQEMQYWAESKQETGAFTGSTGVKVLSPSELNSGVQAWAKRDQLTSATPVRGGMGMALLQKMGWQPGEGLGKNKEGTLEPLRLEVKMDKKGLLTPDENRKGKKGPGIPLQGPPLPTVKTLDGKHPVSLLNELCSRRRYGVPQFELCFECGPDHRKNFLFKVKVNGIEYTPSVASPNKKQAKAEAAAICLRALGIISNNPQN